MIYLQYLSKKSLGHEKFMKFFLNENEIRRVSPNDVDFSHAKRVREKKQVNYPMVKVKAMAKVMEGVEKHGRSCNDDNKDKEKIYFDKSKVWCLNFQRFGYFLITAEI